jgi:hypothetical protein
MRAIFLLYSCGLSGEHLTENSIAGLTANSVSDFHKKANLQGEGFAPGNFVRGHYLAPGNFDWRHYLVRQSFVQESGFANRGNLSRNYNRREILLLLLRCRLGSFFSYSQYMSGEMKNILGKKLLDLKLFLKFCKIS